MHTQKNSAPSN